MKKCPTCNPHVKASFQCQTNQSDQTYCQEKKFVFVKIMLGIAIMTSVYTERQWV